MPFVKISPDYMTPPPPAKVWHFYNSAAQIDDPLFSIPTPGGPTTAAGALTSEAFGSISSSSNSTSAAVAAVAAAAAATVTPGPNDDKSAAVASAAMNAAVAVSSGPASESSNTLENSVSNLEMSESATPFSSSASDPSRDIPHVLDSSEDHNIGDERTSHVSKKPQPNLESVKDLKDKSKSKSGSTKKPAKKSTVNAKEEKKKGSSKDAGSLDPPVFATVTFSGALAPTSTYWTAFNPNDNLEIEKTFQQLLPKSRQNRTAENASRTDNIASTKSKQTLTNTEIEKDSADFQKDEVLVGIRRIYSVNVRERLIKPVYWRPVRDVSTVVRCEWFFSSTLTPVEPSLEDAVKLAFLKVRPWTQEYLDELKTALEIPDAFEQIKVPISYTLTPDKPDHAPITYSAMVVFAPCMPNPPVAINNKDDGDKVEKSDIVEELDIVDSLKATSEVADTNNDVFNTSEDNNKEANETLHDTPDKKEPDTSKAQKPFPVAYIFPSTVGASTRNPLSYFTTTTVFQLVSCLLTGKVPPGTVTTLQRHFEFKDYKKIRSLPDRPSDELGFVPPKITDLILVIHGIGQKLSERLESFNFTFAMNRFNILISEQLDSPAVKQYLGTDTTILALPVNWRKTLDFEAIKSTSHDQDTGKVLFTLSQITMRSIPAVRNIISDVMLDIPYYMSHHKSLLVESTVKEANRIYRLFLKNNPGFDGYGKTHIIGHSLGSVMALDILSTQPTDIVAARQEKLREIELKKDMEKDTNTSDQNGKQAHKEKSAAEIEDELFPGQFCFNTNNLFFAGSPVGFFLLLENSNLIPRQLYEQELYEARLERYFKAKSTMEELNESLLLDDPSEVYSRPNTLDSLTTESTTKPEGLRKIRSHSLSFSELDRPSNYYPYGCLSVKRLYNVLHYSDPVGYCLNPVVDPEYAESIEQAFLPTEKSFPILESKPPTSGLASNFSFSFGSSVGTDSKAKGEGLNGERSGSFFENWRAKFPEIFSSNPTASLPSTPVDHLNVSGSKSITKKSHSMPSSPIPGDEEANTDEEALITPKGMEVLTSHGMSPSSSMVLEHHSSSENEDEDDSRVTVTKEEESTSWTSRYFMSRLLGSTQRKRSDSQSSVSSVASIRSTLSVQSVKNAVANPMKKNESGISSPSTTTLAPSNTDVFRKSAASGLKSNNSLSPAFAPRAASMPPGALRSHRKKSDPDSSSDKENEDISKSQFANSGPNFEEKTTNDSATSVCNSPLTGVRFAANDEKVANDPAQVRTDLYDGMSYGEKKMHMLNDNGQLDYVIPLVGTLENQYLAMLKAHSSYWDTRDFARLVAIECGRKDFGPDKALKQYRVKRKGDSETSTRSTDTMA